MIAAGLSGAAVIVPCVAWYVAGTAALRQREARLLAAPAQLAGTEAGRLATRIGRRLAALREAESRRPYYDYMGTPIDLGGDCRPDPGVESPLAHGPADPLIWTHFQIDDVGEVTLPTLDGDVAERERQLQLAILEELECASAHRLGALRDGATAVERRLVASQSGVVTIGPFGWHTAAIKGQAALVALREVTTPRAVWTQGFVVLEESLASLIDDSPLPTRVRPGPPADPAEASLPLDGDAWTVSVSPGAAIDDAGRSAARARARFATVFGGGALAAILAAGAVIAIVAQSERLARERASFAASAAPELRTPLAALRLYAEMLADERGDPARRHGYARRVAQEAARLGRVVTNVLGYSHLERGNLGVRPRLGDLAEATEQAVEHLRPALDAAGARVVVDRPGRTVEAWFDPDALQQILHNLLDNAEKYGRGSDDRTLRVTVSVDGDSASVAVADRGPGIPHALRRRLFTPFQRGPAPAGQSGLGLGLALARELTRAQGGELGHADEAGGGSRFTARFSRAADADSPA